MMLEQICRDLVNSRHPPVLKLHKFKQVHDKKNHPCDFCSQKLCIHGSRLSYEVYSR